MSSYVSADALLAEARLILDALGPSSTVLVLEGPDDRRLFVRFIAPTAAVVVSGGKRLLRQALSQCTAQDVERMVFLTDRDFDVVNGLFVPTASNCITTTTCNIESDLVDLGLLRNVLLDITGDPDRAESVHQKTLAFAHEFAQPLAMLRAATEPFGVELKLDKIDHGKYWKRNPGTLDADKLTRVYRDRVRDEGAPLDAWGKRLDELRDQEVPPNGKDLLGAAGYYLEHIVKVRNVAVGGVELAQKMRLCMDDTLFSSWGVASTIRSWEEASGRVVLRETSMRQGRG